MLLDLYIVNFDVLLTVHLSIFISVINQLDAQNFCFTISLFHASTCFEHMCSSSGGQNCIVTRSKLHYTASRGCVMQFWPPDDEHMCSKHVEAWNKLIVKQTFCASSWLITEINILRCTVSKTSKFTICKSRSKILIRFLDVILLINLKIIPSIWSWHSVTCTVRVVMFPQNYKSEPVILNYAELHNTNVLYISASPN